jgi:hypothetical protein
MVPGKLHCVCSQFDDDVNDWPVAFPIRDSATGNERRASQGANR